MSAWNLLDLGTIGYRLVMPKTLPEVITVCAHFR